jgi:hypothetical protein
MAHYLFNLVGAPREHAAELIGRGVWGVDAKERHRDALGAGDLVLLYLGAPASEFIGRAELASAWIPPKAGNPGGIHLAHVEEWDPPVPMSAVLPRIASAQAKAEFDAGVVEITAGEYETAVVVAAERGSR